MTMTPGLRKFVLTAHVTCSVGWLGAVVAYFLLTVFATIILLLHMPTVSYFAGVAAETDSVSLGGLRGELLHAGGGLRVLLVATTLAVYKPRGMTRYGWRKQYEERPLSQP
ncbi:MAG TPA: hypothetical protein VGL70_11855 [Candidatus Binatia bacterium]|jgi:hypothetical protein